MSRLKTYILSGWGTSDAAIIKLMPQGMHAASLPYYRGIDQPLPGYRDAVLGMLDTAANHTLLVGWSLGSMVALEAALALPDTIAGLILISPTACFVNDDDYTSGMPKAIVQRMRRRIPADTNAVLDGFFRQIPGEDERDLMPSLSVLRGEWSETELIAGLAYLEAQDLREQLAGLSMPVLIIHGSSDTICPSAAGLFLGEAISHAEIRMLEGVGHAPFLTRQAAFSNVVQEWLDEHY